ncbi:alpha/beta-hydrolase [Dacryopinax primogenitus]|uniref:S-formylglutathione hydrolase n=1 Tax=Dacryopinax primogenitus (strain DJM 731) TaxID=1858805 RepID=M5G8P4_DACPD|nr:alpha/beta-hydrolase [Dacryopinax primogenitus]EJU00138.1 alpha/beta-hydrolase [Dacryopinax primogenitus]
MPVTKVKTNKCFSGHLTKFSAHSESYGLETKFNVFVPEGEGPFSVLYYLAGLTCDEDTGAMKGTFESPAAKHGIALVFPDTSPRGSNSPNDTLSWDFGTGAGFYIDASHPSYAAYQGYTYVTHELPELLRETGLALDLERQGIMGHSMGGHGALTLYLKSGQYRSCSAFAPITNPRLCPWGKKAFAGYLKGGVEEGKEWDATELLGLSRVKEGLRILFDWGDADEFYLSGQLLPENFLNKVKELGVEGVQGRKREGYDHSYYFIMSFAEEHVAFHAKWLKA